MFRQDIDIGKIGEADIVCDEPGKTNLFGSTTTWDLVSLVLKIQSCYLPAISEEEVGSS